MWVQERTRVDGGAKYRGEYSHRETCPYKESEKQDQSSSDEDEEIRTGDLAERGNECCSDRRCNTWFDLRNWFGFLSADLPYPDFKACFTDVAHGGIGLYEKLIVLGGKTLETFAELHFYELYGSAAQPYVPQEISELVSPEAVRILWTQKRVETATSPQALYVFGRSYLATAQDLPTRLAVAKYVKGCIGFSCQSVDSENIYKWMPPLIEHVNWAQRVRTESDEHANALLQDLQTYLGYKEDRLLPRIKDVLRGRQMSQRSDTPTGKELVRLYAADYFNVLVQDSGVERPKQAAWAEGELQTFMESPAIPLFAVMCMSLQPYLMHTDSGGLPPLELFETTFFGLVAACWVLSTEEKVKIWLPALIQRLRQAAVLRERICLELPVSETIMRDELQQALLSRAQFCTSAEDCRRSTIKRHRVRYKHGALSVSVVRIKKQELKLFAERVSEAARSAASYTIRLATLQQSYSVLRVQLLARLSTLEDAAYTRATRRRKLAALPVEIAHVAGANNEAFSCFGLWNIDSRRPPLSQPLKACPQSIVGRGPMPGAMCHAPPSVTPGRTPGSPVSSCCKCYATPATGPTAARTSGAPDALLSPPGGRSLLIVEPSETSKKMSNLRRVTLKPFGRVVLPVPARRDTRRTSVHRSLTPGSACCVWNVNSPTVSPCGAAGGLLDGGVPPSPNGDRPSALQPCCCCSPSNATDIPRAEVYRREILPAASWKHPGQTVLQVGTPGEVELSDKSAILRAPSPEAQGASNRGSACVTTVARHQKDKEEINAVGPSERNNFQDVSLNVKCLSQSASGAPAGSPEAVPYALEMLTTEQRRGAAQQPLASQLLQHQRLQLELQRLQMQQLAIQQQLQRQLQWQLQHQAPVPPSPPRALIKIGSPVDTLSRRNLSGMTKEVGSAAPDAVVGRAPARRGSAHAAPQLPLTSVDVLVYPRRPVSETGGPAPVLLPLFSSNWLQSRSPPQYLWKSLSIGSDNRWTFDVPQLLRAYGQSSRRGDSGALPSFFDCEHRDAASTASTRLVPAVDLHPEELLWRPLFVLLTCSQSQTRISL